MLAFLDRGGETGALVRALGWQSTPLGSPLHWPPPLKTLVGVMLAAEQPMFVAWGDQRTLIYNDRYVPLLADRHPWALGKPFFEVWAEASAALTPLFDQVFSGVPIHMDDIELVLDRPGKPPEAHFAFSYTPVRDDAEHVVALFCVCSETTDVVLGERRRRAAAERQRLMFQQMPGFVALLSGPEHVYDYVNDAYVEIAGKKEFIGRGVREVFPELEEQGFFKLLDGVYATGQSYAARAMPVHLERAGGDRYIDLLYEPMFDEQQRVHGIFVGGYDVTDRIRAEAELRASEARLRAVIDAAPVGLVFADSVGRITGANARVEEIIGHAVIRSPNADSYDEWVSFHADGRRVEGHEYPLARVVHGEDHAELEVLYRRGDGRDAWVRFIATAVRDAEGRVQGGVVASLDVDRERRAERALRDLNADLERQVTERAVARGKTWQLNPDLLVVIDAAGRLEATNPAWAATLGWREEDIAGRPFSEFVHPDDQASSAAAWADATERGVPALRFENRYRHKAGGWRWLSWVAVPDGGKVYCSARDISPEKEQAQTLLQIEEALRQSQKMEAVGQLTGGLAHDFNNLLAGISGSLEMIERNIARGRGDDIARFIATAKGATKRAAALTHRLLAFSRRQALDPKPTDINRLLAELEELIRRTVGPAVALEVIGLSDLWPTLVDPNQLENAVLNLCINARDAMPRGGRLTLQTANRWVDERSAPERDLPPGPYVSVCVSDTGVGMSSEVMAKAFDPFFTTKPLGEGTGLGLSMTYGFARQSGGQVRIHSRIDEGTTVCIYLPRHGEAAVDSVPAPTGPMAQAGREEVVMVIDDEPSVRMLVAEILGEAGYSVIEASDGPTGLRLLQAAPRVDLLITDVGLPGGLNGRQVADAARIARPRLQVLFITGYAENAVVGNGRLDAGMALITKPFAMEALAQKVHQMLKA